MSKTKKNFIKTMENVIYVGLEAVGLLCAAGMALGLFIMVMNIAVGFVLSVACMIGGGVLAAFLPNHYTLWYREKFPEVYGYYR